MSDEQPFGMLNALWFKPEGGAEKYREYMRAAAPIVQRFGGKPQRPYAPQASIIGEFDADLVFFVEWPSWNVFQQFVSDPEYAKVRPLREEAISRSLLIRCAPLGGDGQP